MSKQTDRAVGVLVGQAAGVAPKDHVEFWVIDSDDANNDLAGQLLVTGSAPLDALRRVEAVLPSASPRASFVRELQRLTATEEWPTAPGADRAPCCAPSTTG
jgi:hypothetical protein